MLAYCLQKFAIKRSYHCSYNMLLLLPVIAGRAQSANDGSEPKTDRPVSNLGGSYVPSEDVAAIQSDTIRLPKT